MVNFVVFFHFFIQFGMSMRKMTKIVLVRYDLTQGICTKQKPLNKKISTSLTNQ